MIYDSGMSITLWAIMSVAAFVTATISGFLGMAGGLTLIAVMTTILPAAWVVPLHGVIQLCSNSSRTLVFLKHVRWRIVAAYAPLLGVGVLVGRKKR